MRHSNRTTFALLTVLLLHTSTARADDIKLAPVDEVLTRLPKSETPIRLYNGKDLTGWDGDKAYWSAEPYVIKGSNSKPVRSSTYLFTEKSYRNFRLLLEVKQTISPKHSTMHSAVAALGKRFTDKGDNKHGFRGPLLMFGHEWGIWDAYRRNRIVPRGDGPKAEKKRRMEPDRDSSDREPNSFRHEWHAGVRLQGQA